MFEIVRDRNDWMKIRGKSPALSLVYVLPVSAPLNYPEASEKAFS